MPRSLLSRRRALPLLATLLLACGLAPTAFATPAPPAAPAAPAAARQRPQAPDAVDFKRDVVYGKGGGEDLTLSISRPRDAERSTRLPCILVIHGGGWSGGNKAQHEDLTWQLAQRGYVAATIGYRLAPKHLFPAAVEDVKCAARYLRAHADEYGIDADRLGAIGFSAGGHLSMMLGVTNKEDGLEGEGGSAEQSSRVQAVVSFFGPTQLDADDIPERVKGILRNFIGGTAEEKPDAYRKGSPITYLSSDRKVAPMLLLQGTADPLVPPTQAYKMADAMGKAGATGRAEILPGLGHGWGGAELKRSAEVSFAFFDQHLNHQPPKQASAKEK